MTLIKYTVDINIVPTNKNKNLIDQLTYETENTTDFLVSSDEEKKKYSKIINILKLIKTNQISDTNFLLDEDDITDADDHLTTLTSWSLMSAIQKV